MKSRLLFLFTVLSVLMCFLAIMKTQKILQHCIDSDLETPVLTYVKMGGDPYLEIVPGMDLVLYSLLFLKNPEDLLSDLVNSGVDINHRSSGGLNYLMLASFHWYPESIDLLYKLGIDLAAVDDQGNNFLTYLPGKGSDEDYLKKYVIESVSRGLDPCSLSRNKKARNYESLEALGYKNVADELKKACLQRQQLK